MSSSGKRHARRLRLGLAGATVFAALAGVVVAEQVLVKQDVAVLPEKKPLADPLEMVPADTALQVLSRDDAWVRVRTPSGKEGFVSVDDLPANTNVAGLSGNAVASDVATGAAGRGFGKNVQEDAGKYAGAKHLDPAGLKQMLAMNAQVSTTELAKFAKAGNVGKK